MQSFTAKAYLLRDVWGALWCRKTQDGKSLEIIIAKISLEKVLDLSDNSFSFIAMAEQSCIHLSSFLIKMELKQIQKTMKTKLYQ